MPEENVEIKQTKLMGFTPRELLFRYLKYLPWIALSLGVMLILAFLKLRYSTPIYNVTGKLLVKTETQNFGSEKFDQIFMMQGGNRNLNDEIEIIKSTAIAERVVRALGLQLQVYNKGKIRSSSIHSHELPFTFSRLNVTDTSVGFTLLLTILNDNDFRLNENSAIYHFNVPFTLSQGQFEVLKNSSAWRSFGSNQFVISLRPAKQVAAGLSGGLRVINANDISNVISLSYETDNPRIGLDVVDQYMHEYQQATLEDKKQIAVNTLAFIGEQLDTVRFELGGVERNLQNYRERNNIFSPEQQTQQLFTLQSETEQQITQQSVKMKVIDYLINYISDRTSPYRIVPSSLGIDEPSLIQQISEFNRLQFERETRLKTTPPGNPLILNLETGIERLRNDMIENLRNVRKTYLVLLEDLNRKNQLANSQIKSIPGKEKQSLEVTRQQSILQELYSYLLQKKLETSISSASTISNIRVVEPAAYSNVPIKPNRKGIYMMAVFIALVIPGVIIFLREYLNDKIKNKADIQHITTAPIIGEVGHSEESGVLIVTKYNRKFIAEQFRIIRSNLQYILPKMDKPVFLVTSSFSGEGKSFISTNLGGVLALSGKRTVILEFDIRKPKIMKGLGMTERKGITNYLVGNVSIQDIIHQVPDIDDLYVIPCGPVPPNPAEILLQEKVGLLFKQLRRDFDVVIVDTAPVGLVSDAVILGEHANATMYIVRHDYTLKKQVQLIEELYVQKKLPHLSIIINDIRITSGYGGYYGYAGYGYGYGYGNGYGNGAGAGYFENGKSEKKSWMNWGAKKKT